jgi:peptide/nickel transport system substrate-binding protein
MRPSGLAGTTRFAAIVLALAAAMACSGRDEAPGGGVCAEKWAQMSPAYGDAIVEATIGDASNLIPMLAGDSASHAVSGMIFDGMLAYDKNLSGLEPRLAERWEVSDDGLQITFFLRKDVKWQDGVGFTARDVEFGFKTITDPNTLTAYAEDFRQVQKFELLDDYTFRVTYEKPYAPALAAWGSMVVLPRHLLEGKDINKALDFARNPVGLGTHKLESWETGMKITLRSNHGYYRGRPYIERVVNRIIPDSQTQFLELQSGGIDQMGLSPLQYSRQTDTPAFAASFRKYEYLTNSYTYLGYNLQRPMFQDVRVRRALTHAIDKKEIIDAVLLGLGEPATVPYKPGTDWFNRDVPDFAYDPAKARALLAEAGWKDTDGDGVLDKDGAPFAFKILTNQGNDQRLKSATVIQRRLKEVGVQVDVRVVEWAAFINEFVDKRNFDAVVLGWSLDPDPDQYIIWHSSKTAPKEFNFVTYSNPEVDELLEQGRRTFDRAERKRIYDRFQEILVADQPYTFLYYAKSLPAVHCRFQGIEPAPAGIGYNFERWYVPEAIQKYAVTAAP